jgi:hypothetical protein
MKSLNPLDTLSCEAFIRAIPQLNEPLSDALQTDIRRTLQAIANQRPQSTDLIRAMLDQYPDFQAEYEAAYRKLQTQYQRNERAKGSFALPTEPSLADISRLAAQLFAADQPITSARQWVEPIQTAPTAKPADLWEKGDRVVAMASGGAFLVALLGQIPGAILGSILAGIYGWYTGSEKVRTIKKTE